MNALEDICYGKYVHPYINARDYGLKIRDRIIKIKSSRKIAEISTKRMGKGLHKVFKDVVN